MTTATSTYAMIIKKHMIGLLHMDAPVLKDG